jgi:hypothetical protein
MRRRFLRKSNYTDLTKTALEATDFAERLTKPGADDQSMPRSESSSEVDPVTDPASLARKYLAKERTPQAGYRRHLVLGGRLRGSHRLDGGGDRVRLSRDLERDSIDAGYVENWQHTNAQRSAGRATQASNPRVKTAFKEVARGWLLLAEQMEWMERQDKAKEGEN